MATFNLKAHGVHALRIENIEPLIVGDKLFAPKDGIILRLEDGSTRKWLAERGVAMPTNGDWFVVSEALGQVFVVPAAAFDLLFQVA